MKVFRSLLILAVCLLSIPSLHAQTKKLTTAEAKDHIGERAMVCGKVVSTHYAKSSKGEPTFLNLDEPYPKEVFTILIWGSDREKFGAPEDEYKGLRVCVTGKITSYRGQPEIVATERDQIEIQK
jgi:DNA/RNA endonuclease YhcR with UshA esterase domain